MHRGIRRADPLGCSPASVVRHASVREPRAAETDRSRRPRPRGRHGLSAHLRPHGRQAVGAEALCRFTAAPLRTPDVWFAEAADVGLGIELEITAVRRAVQSLEWLDPSIALGVNVSPEASCSLELPELLETVPAERLVLEITENAPVHDYERLGAALAPMRARGVRLAIDDTCSGYASLRHVLHLRPDTIKLDITLTRGVETDTARRLLVEALVGFAPSVGAEVLAEGIEGAEQLRTLMDAGVQLGQGHYLGRPGPLPNSGTWPAWGNASTFMEAGEIALKS
ncbi:MAG: EAL domain-containing protein [Actinomycetota bacterium]|nr:EAL domain-containing protein [Actinomycetota bacterium]